MSKQKGAVLLVEAGDAIGAAVARRFAEGGYKVCIARREAEKSIALAEEMAAKGFQLRALSVDARKEEEVKKLFAEVEKTVGPSKSASLTLARTSTSRCSKQPTSYSSKHGN